MRTGYTAAAFTVLISHLLLGLQSLEGGGGGVRGGGGGGGILHGFDRLTVVFRLSSAGFVGIPS